MLSVEAIHRGVSSPLGEYDSLVLQALEHVPDTGHRRTSPAGLRERICQETSHLSRGEGRVGAGEDGKHIAIEGRRDHSQRVLDLHVTPFAKHTYQMHSIVTYCVECLSEGRGP